MEKDYSGYRLSDFEKYRLIRSDNKYITYGFYDNYVSFLPATKTVRITVNTRTEFANLYDYVEHDGSAELLQRLSHQYDDEESVASVKSSREELKAHMKHLYEKYNIELNRNKKFENNFYEKHPELSYVPPSVALSSCVINRPLGEGILEFIYVDFRKIYIDKYHMSVMIMENKDFFSEYCTRNPVDSKNNPPQKILNQVDEQINSYFEYDSSCDSTRDLSELSLYTAVCPPLLKENIGIKFYYNYLRALQKEYLEMITFCFDEDYYPELLSNLKPEERYYAYRNAKGLSYRIERNDELNMEFGPLLNEKNKPDFPATMERIKTVFPEDSLKKLSEELGTTAENLSCFLRGTHNLVTRYRFSATAEILELEFSKMLENDIRFRKCRRCGKYFIMKGNYDTRYCDRIAEGETRSCQELAAQENYKKKTAENKALPIYSKYYKRYAARVKVRQIKERDFKKWKYEALVKRDECTAGKITPEDYIEWLENCFPNRKRKEK